MARKWEPQCIEFTPTSNGNADADSAQRIVAFFRPFGVGDNFDFLDEYRKLAEVFQKAAKDVTKAEEKGKPTSGLIDKMKAAERAVYDHSFQRVIKVTRGPVVCDSMEDYQDTVYPDGATAKEIAAAIAKSGTVQEEERPT
jgi:hypothetical protein